MRLPVDLQRALGGEALAAAWVPALVWLIARVAVPTKMLHSVAVLVLGQVARLAKALAAARLVADKRPLASVHASVLDQVAILWENLKTTTT